MNSESSSEDTSTTPDPPESERTRILLIDAKNVDAWQQRLKTQLAGLAVISERSIVNPKLIQEAEQIANGEKRGPVNYARTIYNFETKERIALVKMDNVLLAEDVLQAMARMLPGDLTVGNRYILTASQRAVTKMFLGAAPSSENGYVAYMVLPSDRATSCAMSRTAFMLFEVLECPNLASHKGQRFVPFAEQLKYRKVKVYTSAVLVVRKNMVVRYCGSTQTCHRALVVCFDEGMNSSNLQLDFINSSACLLGYPEVLAQVCKEVMRARKDGLASTISQVGMTFEPATTKALATLDLNGEDEDSKSNADEQVAKNQIRKEDNDSNAGKTQSSDDVQLGPSDCHVRPCALGTEATDPCRGILSSGVRCGKMVHPYCNNEVLGHVIKDPDKDKLYCSDCYTRYQLSQKQKSGSNSGTKPVAHKRRGRSRLGREPLVKKKK